MQDVHEQHTGCHLSETVLARSDSWLQRQGAHQVFELLAVSHPLCKAGTAGSTHLCALRRHEGLQAQVCSSACTQELCSRHSSWIASLMALALPAHKFDSTWWPGPCQQTSSTRNCTKRASSARATKLTIPELRSNSSSTTNCTRQRQPSAKHKHHQRLHDIV